MPIKQGQEGGNENIFKVGLTLSYVDIPALSSNFKSFSQNGVKNIKMQCIWTFRAMKYI